MTTLKEVKIAINALIDSNFVDIPIQSTDITEGFTRPSFFVEFDNVAQDVRLNCIIKNLMVRIYYFPTSKNDYSLEVLQIQEKLQEIFGLNIKIGEKVITIDETTAFVVDAVLEFEFELQIIDDARQLETGDLMQEIIIS